MKPATKEGTCVACAGCGLRLVGVVPYPNRCDVCRGSGVIAIVFTKPAEGATDISDKVPKAL